MRLASLGADFYILSAETMLAKIMVFMPLRNKMRESVELASRKVIERSERALMKTRILAKNPAKMLRHNCYIHY